jgi:hypothetical protein
MRRRSTGAGARERTVTEPILVQFRFSHFNEKARWALDYKGVPHRRHRGTSAATDE